MARAVAAQAPHDSRLAAANRRFWHARPALDTAILETRDRAPRDHPRDEPPPDHRVRAQPIHLRLLLTGELIDDSFLQGIIDVAVDRIAQRRGADERRRRRHTSSASRRPAPRPAGRPTPSPHGPVPLRIRGRCECAHATDAGSSFGRGPFVSTHPAGLSLESGAARAPLALPLKWGRSEPQSGAGGLHRRRRMWTVAMIVSGSILCR